MGDVLRLRRHHDPAHARPNKRIDTFISTPLFNLPLGGHRQRYYPPTLYLPQRNLLRHLTWSLPSGLRGSPPLLGSPVLSSVPTSRGADGSSGSAWSESTPLWYYVLREAQVLNDGLRLGPVGGRITAEVLVGLLRSDPASFLAVDPAWQPTLPHAGQSFAMTDFLTFAGVDPQTRGQ